MANCVICGNEYAEERAELGYNYCMDKKCVKEGKRAPRFVEVGYGKSGVDLQEAAVFDPNSLKNTGNRGRS